MPRPPFTRFPKDTPLPISQRNEITKAFKSATSSSKSGGGIVEQTVVVQTSSGGAGGGATSALAGDVVGPAGANTVAKIQGTALATRTISTGETYVMIGGMLTPSTLAGDVQGSLVGNTVGAIQGAAVLAEPPADQQALVYSAQAGAYVPVVPPGAILQLWASSS